MLQADLHLDTPTQLVRTGARMDDSRLQASLAALRAGGTNIAVMALWPPRASDGPAVVEQLLAAATGEDARLPGLALARTPAEARAIAGAGGTAMALSLEGAHGLGDRGPAALAALHARGLSMLGLASFSNRYAGSSGDGGGGLSAEGRALVAAANDLGVMVDVSHASHQATLDACAASRAPLVASHSNAKAVHDVPRNMADDEIACLCRGGGVIGANSHAPFVGKPASVARLADHMEHVRALGGAGCVALGTDFDGMITATPGLATAADTPKLWAELRGRGWSDLDLAGARGENYLRAWQAVVSAAKR